MFRNPLSNWNGIIFTLDLEWIIPFTLLPVLLTYMLEMGLPIQEWMGFQKQG